MESLIRDKTQQELQDLRLQGIDMDAGRDFRSPAREARRPQEGATRQPLRRGREDGERRKSSGNCVAESFAPTFTLAAKPLAAYHFVAFAEERRPGVARLSRSVQNGGKGTLSDRSWGATARAPLVSDALPTYLC